MKKYLAITLILSICSLASDAQTKKTKTSEKKGFLRIGLGYNIPTSASYTAYGTPLNGSLFYNSNGLTNYKLKKASFNAGLQASLAIGIMLNKHVGLELNNVVGLLPVKYTANVAYPDNGYDVTEQYNKRANGMFFTIPSLVLQYGDKAQLYTRVGAVLPVISTIENAFVYNATFNTTTQYYKGKETLSHKFNVGMSAAIGVKGKIAKGVNGWAEMNYMSLVLSVRKSELTEYFVNGQNVLNRVASTTRQYTTSTANSGTSLPTRTNPFGSVGLHLGISFTF